MSLWEALIRAKSVQLPGFSFISSLSHTHLEKQDALVLVMLFPHTGCSAQCSYALTSTEIAGKMNILSKTSGIYF